MIRSQNKKTIQGQVALVLILLTAAALIFFAITLNWGKIAQTKSMVTIAADEGATMLASNVASYGEMWKQTYLSDANQTSGFNSFFEALLEATIIIIAVVITIVTWGSGSGIWTVVGILLAVVSVVMAVANVILQLAVVDPGICSLWNSLQKNQPLNQQMFEEGIVTALSGVVGDQVNVTDYFDLNINGLYGYNTLNSVPYDSIGRFAFFYTDRLKMLDMSKNPQVTFFYGQLNEFINGETCAQNALDNSNYNNVGLYPYCASLGTAFCITNSSSLTCQTNIPNVIQLNDGCSGSDPTNNTTYSPYCDPCCQPYVSPNPKYNPNLVPANPLQPKYNVTRPSNCGTVPPDCDPASASFNPSATDCVPVQCQVNNPYDPSGLCYNQGSESGSCPYPYLYDTSFQKYGGGASFLDQFGRDQQMAPFNTSSFILAPQGSASNGLYFPNGAYPFFYLTNGYSPQVDTIDPTTGGDVSASQYHWCVAGSTIVGGTVPPTGTPPQGFPDLAQLTLPYTCQGKNCCVNYLANSVGNNAPLTATASLTATNNPASISVNITSTSAGLNTTNTGTNIFTTSSTANIIINVSASEPSGTINTVLIYNGIKLLGTAVSTGGNNYSFTWSNVPANTYPTNPNPGEVVPYNLTAVATDANNISMTSSPPTTVTIYGPVPDVSTLTASNQGTAISDGGSVVAGTEITFKVCATEIQSGPSTGYIANVAFYENNGTTVQLLSGTVTQTTGTMGLNNLVSCTNYSTISDTTGAQAGTYNFYAVATDNYGGFGNSNTVTVTITPAT